MIDRAFVQALIAAQPAVDLALENGTVGTWNGSGYDWTLGNYTPTTGRPWAEVRHLPNDRTPGTLAHTDDTDGVLRLILRYPQGDGEWPAKEKAEEIRAAFPIGRRVDAATVTNSRRQPGVAENGWYVLQLDLAYRAALTR